MRRWWWVVLGVVLLGSGVAVLWRDNLTVSSGWFAYSPLEGQFDGIERSFQNRIDAQARDQVLGLLLAVSGLLVLVGGTCYRLGLRRRDTAPPPSSADPVT